ncbi:MAG: TonB-dependent receptor [Balneolaceae bacterium]|nr:MAG: TonB-dependent receptor [Balneolaceae bacterium]
MKSTIRKFTLKVFLFPLLFFFLSTSLFAQESSTDTLTVQLDEIQVEAAHSSITIGRSPVSVSFLNRSEADITARPAVTMDELTFTLPGIWISNRENAALGERMTVRGMGWRSPFGLRGVMVVLDDIPLTVADGQTIMNMVDPAMVQSIELLRGPSATYWGNSSGGVLYMRTRPPADSPRLMMRSFGGAYNTMKYEARWHDTIGGVRWNAYGSYFESDGFRDHSASELIRAGVSAGFDLSANSSLETRIAFSGMPKAQHPGSLPADDALNSPSMAWPAFVDAGAGKDFMQWMASTRYLYSTGSGLLTVSAHGTLRDFNNPLLPNVGYIIVDRVAGGSRATYDFDNLPFNLQVGGELKFQRDEREQRNNVNGQPGNQLSIDQTDKVFNQALFAQTAFELNRLTLNIGLRADRMVFGVDDFLENEDSNRSFLTINPSVGINYDLNNARLFASISSSFDAPTTTEFKNRPGGGTGFNPDLLPERTIGAEAGLRGTINSNRIQYDITLFGLNITDLIVPFQEIDGGPTLFRNEGNTVHYGLESHIRFYPGQRYSVDVMYTWINAEFADGEFEGNEIPGVAPHRIGTMLTGRFGEHTIITDVEWIGEYFADSANSASNESYFLINGRWSFAGLHFDTWRLQPFVSVQNIFNQRYNTSVSVNAFGGRYFEPGSNRNVRAGIRLDVF